MITIGFKFDMAADGPRINQLNQVDLFRYTINILLFN